MTTTQIQSIADKHLDLWFCDDPNKSQTTLRDHFTNGIIEALARVEKLAAEVVDLTFAAMRWKQAAEAARLVPKQVKAQGAVEP